MGSNLFREISCVDKAPNVTRNNGYARGSPSTPTSRVLLPVGELSSSQGAETVAQALARYEGGDIILTRVVAVPEQTPLELPDRMLRPHREALCESVDSLSDSGVDTSVKRVIRVGHRPPRIVAHTAADHDATTIVTRSPDTRPSLVPLRRSWPEWLQANASSRLVVTHGAGELDHVSSILVAVAGGPHSGATVETARALAVDHDAWIDLLHIVKPDASDERQAQARQYLEESQQRLQGFDRHDTWLLEADDVVDAIAEQSAYYDVTALGGPRSGRLRRSICGSTTSDVETSAESAVLTVWSEDTTP